MLDAEWFWLVAGSFNGVMRWNDESRLRLPKELQLLSLLRDVCRLLALGLWKYSFRFDKEGATGGI